MIKRNTLVAILFASFVFVGCKNSDAPGMASAFKISDVKILDGPFLKAQKTDLDYILDLDMDRLLAPYLKDAGIKPMKDNYGNWENTGLDGHIGGHYLSALSFMYAASGDKELLDRINYMITWLGRCQEKNGNGYVGGIPYGQKIWKEISEGNINAGTFSLNDRWVPLYNIHKLFAGLYDVYMNTGNDYAKTILINLTDWFYNTTANLTDEQIQTMLISEHGGLNEVFADVYELTGNQKYLDMAKRFSHKVILEPLIAGKNELTGLHANTQIPKVIGFEKYAQLAHDQDYANAASFFWNTVIDEWTISIGGNSVREHFHSPDDFSSMVESEQGPESCNTYNMLKLTKLLYMNHPEAKYVDYYERALFNHILSTENTNRGGFVYFTPMRPRHYRVYSQPQFGFWCCVGSGLENPGRYGEMIYAKKDNTLYVNMFMASEVNWSEKELTLVQQTSFPYQESSKLIVQTEHPQSFTLKIRYAKWMVDGSYTLAVNGQQQTLKLSTDGFAMLKRKWKNNDTISVDFQMRAYTEFLPDSSNWISFLHGPIVLGAVTDTTNQEGLWADDSRMGHVANGPKYPIDQAPAIVIEDIKDVERSIVPIEGKPMHFELNNLVHNDTGKMELCPFFEIQEARYMVYWPIYSKSEFSERQAELARQEQEMLELANQTIDMVMPGEQQPEADHFIRFDNSRTGVFKGRHWRHASGYFSYQFKNPGKEKCFLRVTYYGADQGRTFKILVNNSVIATVSLDGSYGDRFVDVDYPVSAEAVAKSGGNPVEIKFTPEQGSVAGGIFGVRLMRAK